MLIHVINVAYKAVTNLNNKNLDIHEFKAEFFKALAHPIRIQLLELLADGDKFVNELQSHMDSSSATLISQHLAILRSKNIVKGERDGNKVKYSVTDRKIIKLLDVAKEVFNNQLSKTISMLNKMDNK